MSEEEVAFKPGNAANDLLKHEDKQHFQSIFASQAVQSYLFLSLGMGVVAFLLTPLLVYFGGYDEHFSISSFYYAGDSSRNIFVGSLWATGTFLFLFHGLSNLENWILNCAGVAAIFVAMVPMSEAQCPSSGISLHALGAIFFFLCLSIVAVFLSKGRVKYIVNPRKKLMFTAAYNLTGIAMVAMPALAAVPHILGSVGCESHWLFWVETTGILAFSMFWFIKTAEYRLLLGIK